MLQSNTCRYILSASGHHNIVSVVACRHLAFVSMSILQVYYSLVTFAETKVFFLLVIKVVFLFFKKALLHISSFSLKHGGNQYKPQADELVSVHLLVKFEKCVRFRDSHH